MIVPRLAKFGIDTNDTLDWCDLFLYWEVGSFFSLSKAANKSIRPYLPVASISSIGRP